MYRRDMLGLWWCGSTIRKASAMPAVVNVGDELIRRILGYRLPDRERMFGLGRTWWLDGVIKRSNSGVAWLTLSNLIVCQMMPV